MKKGKLNENGQLLMNYCKENELVLTNTLFNHKMAHRTTWEAPYREFSYKDGTTRRNPIRNQIDYAICRTKHRRFITDSRSYSGMISDTDHRLVIMKTKFHWKKMKKFKKVEPKIQIQNLNQNINQELYSTKVKEYNAMTINNEEPQQIWTNISKNCLKAAEEIVGKAKTDKLNDAQINNLSNLNKKLRNEISKTNDIQQRNELGEKRKEIKKKIKTKIKEHKEQILNERLHRLNQFKDDSNKYYTVMRELQNKEKKKAIIVWDKETKEIAGSTEDKILIITEHFKSVLAPTNMEDEIITYQPIEMQIPFTMEEIKKAAKRLKNGKSVGIDNINAELIKYAPDCTHQEMAKMYNLITKTGNFPSELVTGLLAPLPKPNKIQGPAEHLRPIILLSIARKVLTIVMLDRIWTRLKTYIPKEQSAYQPGRGTTEQLLSVKILCEKAITSNNFTIYMQLIDMQIWAKLSTPSIEKCFSRILKLFSVKTKCIF